VEENNKVPNETEEIHDATTPQRSISGSQSSSTSSGERPTIVGSISIVSEWSDWHATFY
jgi:hypothetical protein